MLSPRHASCVPYIASMRAISICPRSADSFLSIEVAVSGIPFSLRDEPVGIVVRLRQTAERPIRSWAFLWASDEDSPDGEHWHDRVPVARRP